MVPKLGFAASAFVPTAMSKLKRSSPSLNSVTWILLPPLWNCGCTTLHHPLKARMLPAALEKEKS